MILFSKCSPKTSLFIIQNWVAGQRRLGIPAPMLIPHPRIKIPTAMVAAMIAAMVAPMGLLWLLLWDCYGCCHGKAE